MQKENIYIGTSKWQINDVLSLITFSDAFNVSKSEFKVAYEKETLLAFFFYTKKKRLKALLFFFVQDIKI